MKTKLIILRGNSGSGKTTIAKELQMILGLGTLVVSQDVVRREMLKVQDRPGNLSIDLIHQIALYGKDKVNYVIVEGILYRKRYGEMLLTLIRQFTDNVYIYYFDLPFEETIRRHQAKPNANEFGEAKMREWWIEKDYLRFQDEKKITETMTESDVLDMILQDIGFEKDFSD